MVASLLADYRDAQMGGRWSDFVSTPRFDSLKRKTEARIVDEGNGCFALLTDDGKLTLRNRLVDEVISRLDPVFGSDSDWGGTHISNTDITKNNLVIGALCYLFARENLTEDAFQAALIHANQRELWQQPPTPQNPAP